MTSKRKRNDYINFVIDAAHDDKLTEKFFRRKTPLGIYRFFQQEGYKDIALNDCEEILAASKNMRGKGINLAGKAVDSSRVIAKY